MTKLVYKRNIGVEGKLEFYVAKTLAKGYSLKLCFNNGKPFQQWSYSDSIILLLSITLCLFCKIQKPNIFIANGLMCTWHNEAW